MTIFIYQQTWCSRGGSTNTFVTDSFSHNFPSNLQNIINHKPPKLGSWHFKRMFTSHLMSDVTCHVSPFTCHMSHVTCHMSHVMCHMSQEYKNIWSLSWRKIMYGIAQTQWSRGCSINSLIHWLFEWSFSSKSSNH